MTQQRVPETTFKTRVRNDAIAGDNPFEWKDLTSTDIFAAKRVVVFSLPGAFTPTCSTSHLPRYEELHEKFTALGVDQVICLSVNDAFVMFQWGKAQGTSGLNKAQGTSAPNKAQGADKVFLLPDGNGEFTRKMGMLVDKSNLGFGMRSWRYSMVVNDGEIEKMFVEAGYMDNCPDDPFEVSGADTMLAYLEETAKTGASKAA